MGTMTNDQLFPRYRMTAKQREIAKEINAVMAERNERYARELAAAANPIDLFTEMFGDA